MSRWLCAALAERHSSASHGATTTSFRSLVGFILTGFIPMFHSSPTEIKELFLGSATATNRLLKVFVPSSAVTQKDTRRDTFCFLLSWRGATPAGLSQTFPVSFKHQLSVSDIYIKKCISINNKQTIRIPVHMSVTNGSNAWPLLKILHFQTPVKYSLRSQTAIELFQCLYVNISELCYYSQPSYHEMTNKRKNMQVNFF